MIIIEQRAQKICVCICTGGLEKEFGKIKKKRSKGRKIERSREQGGIFKGAGSIDPRPLTEAHNYINLALRREVQLQLAL